MAATEPVTPPPPDYPAAHSMDTTWFAVDDEGELGVFQSGERSDVPVLEGMEPEISLTRPTTIGQTEEGATYYKLRSTGDKIENAAKKIAPSEQDNDHYHHEKNYWERENREGFYDSDYWYTWSPRFHEFHAPDTRGPYYWHSSPEKPLLITDLPKELRGASHILRLKDYVFRSREPIDPLYHAANCFSYTVEHFTPHHYGMTLFPVPTRIEQWNMRDFFYCADNEVNGRFFIATDKHDRVALFRTDRFGAAPESATVLDMEKLWSGICLPREMPVAAIPLRLGELPAGLTPERFYDLENHRWKIPLPFLLLVEHGLPDRSTQFRVATDAGDLMIYSSEYDMSEFIAAIEGGKGKRAWVEGVAKHWLEYAAGPSIPRLFGLFHYDMSWVNCGPYARVSAPQSPIRLSKIPKSLLEHWKPVTFKNCDFTADERIQPFEFAACKPPISDETADKDNLRTRAEIWVNAALTEVTLCTPGSVKYDDDNRLLRRARRHYAMIENLSQTT